MIRAKIEPSSILALTPCASFGERVFTELIKIKVSTLEYDFILNDSVLVRSGNGPGVTELLGKV